MKQALNCLIPHCCDSTESHFNLGISYSILKVRTFKKCSNRLRYGTLTANIKAITRTNLIQCFGEIIPVFSFNMGFDAFFISFGLSLAKEKNGLKKSKLSLCLPPEKPSPPFPTGSDDSRAMQASGFFFICFEIYFIHFVYYT